jgi:antitoxin (DNA-binding transcriptional repressor) of toxin-antitoxin stability system
MRSVGADQARTQFYRLLAEVDRGETVTIPSADGPSRRWFRLESMVTS